VAKLKTAQLRDFLVFTFRQTSEWIKSVVSVAAECHTVSGPPGYGHRVVLPASSAPKMETGLSETSVPIYRTTQHYIPRGRAIDKNLGVKHQPYNAGYLLNGFM
jgi:hypothetical protein